MAQGRFNADGSKLDISLVSTLFVLQTFLFKINKYHIFAN